MEREYDTIDIGKLFALVRKNIKQLVLCTLAGALIFLAASKFLVSPQYEASALLVINTRDEQATVITYDQINSAKQLVATYAVILTNDSLLNDIIEKYELADTPASLRGRIIAEAVDQTQVMRLAVRDEETTVAFSVLTEIINRAPDILIETVKAGSVEIVSPPIVNPHQVSPAIELNIVIGSGMGFLLCFLVVWVRSTFLSTFITSEDIEAFLNLPALGVVPSVKAGDEQIFPLLSSSSPFHYQESFNSLRTNLKFVSANSNCKKIIVTSSMPGEGKSTVTINLALALAADGNRVLLMDCDLRKPAVHRYLRLRGGTHNGLGDVLGGTRQIGEAVARYQGTNLFVLTAGNTSANASTVLGSGEMAAVIRLLEKDFDYILFDTPPVSVVSDSAVLSQYVDGVIFVIRQKVTTRSQVSLARKNLELVNAHIFGTIINGYDIYHSGEAGAYYNYEEYSQ